MASILVSHPHSAAVANATAALLEKKGYLAGYFTGFAASAESAVGRLLLRLQRIKPTLSNRLIAGVPSSRIKSLFWVEGLARTVWRAAAAVGVGGATPYDAIFLAHDRAVAMLPWPKTAEATYAYEDAALRTFRRAARTGMARIWDSPSPHWRTVERMWRDEARRWPEAVGAVPAEPDWKKRRKDEELDLATAIFVASSFTQRSLDGIAQAPVVVAPYGFPVSAFIPKERAPNGPFTVLSVGALNVRKGTHYLLEAWRRARLRDARLRLVGRLALPASYLARYTGLFEHVPHMPRSLLAAEYHAADVLAFPTLCDGFGLVVQEAMCCATPVLATYASGGPECIADGIDGWLVPPGDLEALVEWLRDAARNRDRIRAMGLAARRRAEQWTWKEAAEALLAHLEATLS